MAGSARAHGIPPHASSRFHALALPAILLVITGLSACQDRGDSTGSATASRSSRKARKAQYSTELVKTLQPAEKLPFELGGLPDFQRRVRLATTLPKDRAPGFYREVAENVTWVDFVDTDEIYWQGKQADIKEEASFIDLNNGVLRFRADGISWTRLPEPADIDIFYLASMLVHEAHHRARAREGVDQLTSSEELHAIRRQLQALQEMDAPEPIITAFEEWLAHPDTAMTSVEQNEKR